MKDDSRDATHRWLPLLAVEFLGFMICCGIATAVAGPTMGTYVAISVIVIFVGHLLSACFCSLIL